MQIQPKFLLESTILIFIFLLFWKSMIRRTPAIPNSQSYIDQGHLVISKSERKLEVATSPYYINKERETEPVKNVLINLDEIRSGPLQQDDLRLINYIKMNNIFVPPSEKEYNLTNPNKDPSLGQSDVVQQIFKNKTGGFFVECGAKDGDNASITLILEQKYGWKGLLIEADPVNFKVLLDKHRKAWAINACLSIKPYYQHQVMFKTNGEQVLEDSHNTSKQETLNKTQCYPLFSLLRALNIDTVDYFSLNFEKNELPILETIPFDKILIKVISVKYINHDNEDRSVILTKFMKTKKYRVITKVDVVRIDHGHGSSNDLIFAHSSLVTDYSEIINLG